MFELMCVFISNSASTASVFAAPVTVKWCVISDAELRKCLDLSAHSPIFTCVKRDSALQCIIDITTSIASDTCHYAVAVVKKTSTFKIRDLRGKKSCHTGLGDVEGWNIPIGTLVSMDILEWAGVENEPLVEAVGKFFLSSCVPGATGNLCHLCKGDCSKSDRDLYYGDAGALRCLEEDAGEVAFVKHGTVPDSIKANYELLCKDNTRAPIDNYKSCHLGRVPAHAVVSRKDPELSEFIILSVCLFKLIYFISFQGFNIFSSAPYAPANNLLFTDSTVRLVQVPSDTDSFLYLGAEFMSIIRSLKKGPQTPSTVSTSNPITWCAVGHAETSKCDMWTVNSVDENDQNDIACQTANTVEECVKMIMSKEADAMAMDGGQVYTAGKCGLVPVMAEQYDEGIVPHNQASSYYAVAVVKKNSGVTWENLRGKRSCHTGMGRTAGWNIPMGQIHKETRDCDFSNGCAPGADPTSPFCTQCAGSGKTVGDEAKCKASAEEKYYGYAGAFRCLVEDAGDVAFIKHTIVPENSDGNGPDWARGLRSADYELICPGKGPVPITDFASCNLARVPAHAVMARPESRSKVLRILQDQMFQSVDGKNLLFKDSTKCLQEVQVDNYESFLGSEYMNAMRSLRECSGNTPGLYNFGLIHDFRDCGFLITLAHHIHHVIVCLICILMSFLYFSLYRSGEILHFPYLSAKQLVGRVENVETPLSDSCTLPILNPQITLCLLFLIWF
uniref:Serotransferrin n=1 Tax=Sphaeramia orbicularis TaxID=375764 RepID=A0A673BFN9_9TELE